MIKYKNENYLKHEIMEQSRHQFIYGYNGAQRKQFLKHIADQYPIILDNDLPMAVYVGKYGLPKVEPFNDGIDKSKINIISKEFLYLSIVSDIFSRISEANNLDLLNERLKKIIELLNKYSMNKQHPSVIDLTDLIQVLNKSKELYKKYYLEYYGKGQETISIQDIPLPFIQFDFFIKELKSALNNNSYFGIIIDNQEDIAIFSTQAINSLVGSRINKDISMKVATEPDGWDSYSCQNGQLIESVHDYGTVELDESLTHHIKSLKRKYDTTH